VLTTPTDSARNLPAVTFADGAPLRKKQIAALEEDLARTTTDEDRARIEEQLRELKRFRWSRLLWPLGGGR
jgi:hypothetical protein